MSDNNQIADNAKKSSTFVSTPLLSIQIIVQQNKNRNDKLCDKSSANTDDSMRQCEDRLIWPCNLVKTSNLGQWINTLSMELK